MELSSTLGIHCESASIHSSHITYHHFCLFRSPSSPDPFSSLLASPGTSIAKPPAGSVPMPESATDAPYTTASDFIFSLDIWRWLRSLRTCILWSLPSWQAIKAKIISWTEAHGKVTPGSFRSSKYFGMKRCFPDTLHSIFVSIFFLISGCFFLLSDTAFPCNCHGWFAPEIWILIHYQCLHTMSLAWAAGKRNN